MHARRVSNFALHAARFAMRRRVAGRAILFLKALGPWTDADVAARLLPVHTALLARSEEQLAAVPARLLALGVAGGQVRELLHLCPGLFYVFGDEQLALAERVFESNRRKYALMGSYEV